MILSYGSALDRLDDHLQKHGTAQACNCNVRGIISTATPLLDATRQCLQEALQVSWLNRYTNRENGLLAQDDETRQTFT